MYIALAGSSAGYVNIFIRLQPRLFMLNNVSIIFIECTINMSLLHKSWKSAIISAQTLFTLHILVYVVLLQNCLV